MKRMLLILAILLPVIANAMKIVKDEIDEFSGQRTVITSWEPLKMKSMYVRFRLQGGVQYFDFKTMDDVYVIPQGSKLMVKSSVGDISEFEAISTFSGGKGEGSVSIIGSSGWGISAIYIGNIDWFRANTTVMLRYYTSDGYIDKKFSEKEGRKITELADLFLNTISR